MQRYFNKNFKEKKRPRQSLKWGSVLVEWFKNGPMSCKRRLILNLRQIFFRIVESCDKIHVLVAHHHSHFICINQSFTTRSLCWTKHQQHFSPGPVAACHPTPNLGAVIRHLGQMTNMTTERRTTKLPGIQTEVCTQRVFLHREHQKNARWPHFCGLVSSLFVGWVSSLSAPKCLRFFWPRNKSVKAGNSKRRKSILAEDDKHDFKQQVIHYPRARTYILWYLPSDASSKTCELSCQAFSVARSSRRFLLRSCLNVTMAQDFRCKTRYSENVEPF